MLENNTEHLAAEREETPGNSDLTATDDAVETLQQESISDFDTHVPGAADDDAKSAAQVAALGEESTHLHSQEGIVEFDTQELDDAKSAALVAAKDAALDPKPAPTPDVADPDSSIIPNNTNKVEVQNDTHETPAADPVSPGLFSSAEQIKQEMSQVTLENLVGFQFLNEYQETIETRVYGEMGVQVLNIEDIHTAQHRTRLDLGDVDGLRESIRKYGQLVPILVTTHNDHYVLIQGFRRLEALKGLGQTQVIALVDTTIPAELVKYYEVIANASKDYSFTEKLNYGNFFKETQPSIGYETIENALGMGTGEFLKALYIQYHQEQYPQYYEAVETGKMTISQAMKKLEKDIEKAEKEAAAAGVDELNSGEMDDQLRNQDDLALTTPNADAGTQSVSDRKILDPILRRSIEARDEGMCQCCGFGKGEPDFMGVFQVHHIIPVMYGGSDNKGNLILLCTNCHKLVHDYEKGQFLPEESTWEKYASVKKIVVLGNMLQQLRKQAFTELKKNHIEIFRTVDRGKLGLGKAIAKAKLQLNGEDQYGGSPYQTFQDVTKDLAFGGIVVGDLGKLNTMDDEELEENTETAAALPEEN